MTNARLQSAAKRSERLSIVASMDRAREHVYRRPPGPQTRFSVEEAAIILRVLPPDVRRFIARGWITARRTWRHWGSRREHDGYSIRGRAIRRALDDCDPEFLAELWRARERAIRVKERRGRGEYE